MSSALEDEMIVEALADMLERARATPVGYAYHRGEDACDRQVWVSDRVPNAVPLRDILLDELTHAVAMELTRRRERR